MSGYTREYVKGDDPMYRSVTPYSYRGMVRNPDTQEWEPGETIHSVRYAGPYTTVRAAKRSRGPGGWVEVCNPVWEKLEE